MTSSQQEKPINLPVLIGATLIMYYYLARAFVKLWTLDANGISSLNHKLPEWDFTNLWAGGLLAAMGKLETIFNVTQYRDFLQDFFHATLSHMEWSYPPHMLLLGLPFARLPLFPAYLLWTAITYGMLAWLLYRMQFSTKQLAVVMLSPAVFYSVLIGQNGCLTACLLLGCLHFARARPLLAGILLGVLSVKPQFCLLGAIALLAMGNWRALVASAVTAGSMIALTTLLFGVEIWQLWQQFTLPFMTELLNAPHDDNRMLLGITPFYSFRDVGLNALIAHALQLVITLLCVITTWKLWRNEQMPQHLKLAFTLLLTLLATPYAQAYDMVGAAIAVALLMTNTRMPMRISLYLLWMAPMFIGDLNMARIALAPLVIAAPIFLCYPKGAATHRI